MAKRQSVKRLAKTKAPLMIRDKRAKPNKTFPFLKLPPEIRNMIYLLVLVTVGPIYFINEARKASGGNYRVRGSGLRRLPFNANLIAVCRRICKEAGPILYAKNTFSAPLANLYFFLRQIGSARCLVQDLVIEGFGQTFATALRERRLLEQRAQTFFTLLLKVVNLRRLTLDFVDISLQPSKLYYVEPTHTASKIVCVAEVWLWERSGRFNISQAPRNKALAIDAPADAPWKKGPAIDAPADIDGRFAEKVIEEIDLHLKSG